ncbi:DUF7507 domain-containing protein [Streptomyces sp. NBC_00690]|uniref:DUF7507 domain-containing protein n=1 Tax=Streptomyces sp. NBC_00690 TaxID=2975808 RepID=UPI002E2DB72B|nr:hypothetical protein [Streptomyces sp. NBC_00690]
MRGSSGRRRLSAVVCATAVLAAQAVGLAAALPAPPPAAKAAEVRTVPGTPGVPQAPSVVYAEDFENNTGATPILLPAYVGAPPQNETYTADPVWLNPARCNGIILSQSGADQPACLAQSPVAMNALKALAGVLGQVNGSATPATNHVVSAYTDGDSPGADKVEFQTVNPIAIPTTGRFITFSVDAAALNCAVSAPLLKFYLTGSGPDIPTFSSPINPCTDPRAQNFYGGLVKAGSFPSNGSVLFTGASLGLKMLNGQGSGDGNDHAFDNIRILDVTPQLDKSFDPATITAGGVSTLTLTVTNTTDLAAKAGFGLTDALPAGLTVAATPNAATTCGAGTVAATGGGTSFSLTGGALTAGQASCTVTVDVTATASGSYVNGPGQTTVTGLNPPADATLTVGSAPSITKAVTEASFVAGQALHYTYTVKNNATQPLTNIQVTDTGPGSPTVTCPAGPLAGGASVDCTATYTATAADVTAGQIVNTATLTVTDAGGETVTVGSNQVTVLPRSLTIGKSATEQEFTAAGQTLHYTYTVTNTGGVTLTGVSVNDLTPAVTVSACADTTLAPGAMTTCQGTYTTTAADVAAKNIPDQATVTGNDPGGQPANATSNEVNTPLAALSVVKGATETQFSGPGQTIHYTFTVTNTGAVPLTALSVQDNGPGTPTVTCPPGPLAPNASVDCTATYTTTAADVTAGQIVDTATASATTPSGRNVTGTSNTVTIPYVPPRGVDLAVVKTGPASVAPGGEITYTIVVTNNGPGDSTGWTLTDTIPAGVTGASTQSPGCGIGSGILTCTGGPLANGDSVTVAVTGTAAANATTIENTAKVTGKDPDPDPGNNTSTSTTGVTKLEIVKKQKGSATVRAGSEVEYTITVRNTGTAAYTEANPATFSDDLSELLDDARFNNDATATRGDVSYSEPLLEWSGALAPGQTATITFSITTNARPFGDLQLLNTVTSDTPGNNCPATRSEATPDPRCTTKGTVDARDKDKESPRATRRG